MNFGAFAGGFAQGLDQGLARGKTIRDMLKEAKLQEQRDKAMAEAEQQRSDSVSGMIKETGLPDAPRSGPIDTKTEAPAAATEAPSQAATKNETATVEVGSVPVASTEAISAPTASPDAASAATASDTLAPAPQAVAAPNTATAPAAAQKTKDPLYIVGNGSLATSGMVTMGNIDLNNRTPVTTQDGRIATVRSLSIGVDGKEVLIPTVIDGKIYSNADAIEHYKKTGEHLGIFNSPAEATAYAKALHEQQDQAYAPVESAAPDQTAASQPAPAAAVPPSAETLRMQRELRLDPNAPDRTSGMSTDELGRAWKVDDASAPAPAPARPQAAGVAPRPNSQAAAPTVTTPAPNPAPAAGAAAAPTAAPAAPAAPAPVRPQAAGVATSPAPAAAGPAAAAVPGADIKPPVATGDGRFEVNGKRYATREAAYKAAEAEVPDVEYYYTKKMVPLMTKQLMLEGNPEKALAWQKWGESADGRQYMKDWHSTWIASQVGDYEKAARGVVKMFNKYENGQTLVGQETVKDKQGNITGFNVRIKDDKTGETRSQFINPQALVQLGVNGGSPDKAFELIYKKQAENDKTALEAKIKAQERRDKNEDDIAKIDRKADRDDARQKAAGQQKLSEITLKEQLGDEAANKFKKATTTQERRNILVTERTKDPVFSRKSEAEQKAEIDQLMRVGAVEEDAAKPTATGGPTTFKPAPTGASAEPQLFRNKADGKIYKMVDGKPVLAAPNQQTPAPAAPAAPAATPPAAGPATGLPAPAATAPAGSPAAAPVAKSAAPAAPVDPVMEQINGQSDPTLKTQHVQKYRTYQQITKSITDLGRSYAAAVQAGDNVQSQAISENIAKLRQMAERAKAELSGFYRMPE